MATAFTKKEMGIIRERLKNEARKNAKTIGMRKTTVDQLAESAGISKGAFYKFYASKELLFFELMEEWHEEIYDAAWKALKRTAGLSEKARFSLVLMEACDVMLKNSMVDFLEKDGPFLMRKIPEDVIKAHYHSETVHIKDFLRESEIVLNEPPEVACAAIHCIFRSLSQRKEMGETLYKSVLEIFVFSLSDYLTKKDSKEALGD